MNNLKDVAEKNINRLQELYFNKIKINEMKINKVNDEIEAHKSTVESYTLEIMRLKEQIDKSPIRVIPGENIDIKRMHMNINDKINKKGEVEKFKKNISKIEGDLNELDGILQHTLFRKKFMEKKLCKYEHVSENIDLLIRD